MSILNQRLDFTINRYTLDELPFIEYPYRSTYIFKDTFYSEGTVYARLGLRTRDAENLLILDGVAWDLGNYAVGTTLTQSHTAFVRIDGKLFKIGLEEVL